MSFNNAVNAKQQGTQYLSTAGAWAGVDGGTAGNVLTSNGTGVAPSFQAASAGTYYSLTPYIVGADIHSQFTTISAAITQAVTDGATAATPANIYIKPGTYVESPTLLDGINLIGFVNNAVTVGDPLSNPPALNTSADVVISGTVTYAPTAAAGSATAASMTNLTVIAAVNTDAIVFNPNTGGAPSGDYFSMENVVGFTTGTGRGFFDTNTGSNPNVFLKDCRFSNYVEQANGLVAATGCYFGTGTISNTQGANFNFCNFHGAVSHTSTNGPSIFNNCKFDSTLSNGIASSIGVLNCQVASSLATTGTIFYGGLTSTSALTVTSSAGAAVSQLHGEWGDTILSRTTGSGSGSISAATNYYGNTGAGTATLSLPNTSVGNGQVFIIKDQNGNAGTNNLTVNVTGGVKTIDGAASQVISTNFGVLRVMYDGTNYFTW